MRAAAETRSVAAKAEPSIAGPHDRDRVTVCPGPVVCSPYLFRSASLGVSARVESPRASALGRRVAGGGISLRRDVEAQAPAPSVAFIALTSKRPLPGDRSVSATWLLAAPVRAPPLLLRPRELLASGAPVFRQELEAYWALPAGVRILFMRPSPIELAPLPARHALGCGRFGQGSANVAPSKLCRW